MSEKKNIEVVQNGITTVVENYQEEYHEKILSDISKKIDSIIENLEEIEDYSDTGFCPCSLDNVERLIIDLDCAYDEFFITGNFKSGSEHYANSPYCDDNFLHIEVVTQEVAISNDKDFLEEDEQERYVLGGEFSIYKPLGMSGYWYRLL